MKEFFIYFFGQGVEPEFSLFTLAHFAPILLMIATILLIHRYQDPIRNSKHEETLRFALAFALIIADMSYYWRLVGCPWLEPGPMENLPIRFTKSSHLSDEAAENEAHRHRLRFAPDFHLSKSLPVSR